MYCCECRGLCCEGDGMKKGGACRMTHKTSATFPYDSWGLGGFRATFPDDSWGLGEFRVWGLGVWI